MIPSINASISSSLRRLLSAGSAPSSKSDAARSGRLDAKRRPQRPNGLLTLAGRLRDHGAQILRGEGVAIVTLTLDLDSNLLDAALVRNPHAVHGISLGWRGGASRPSAELANFSRCPKGAAVHERIRQPDDLAPQLVDDHGHFVPIVLNGLREAL